MNLKNIFTVISIILLLAGCQTLPPETVSEVPPPVEAVEPEPAPLPAPEEPALVATESVEPPTDLWERIRRELSWQSLHNAQIGKARDHYLRQTNYLPMIAGRASYYLYYIVEEVEKRDLPMELALLPLVESTLDPFASSSSHAAGLWQIMPATGRYLGLE